MKSSKRISINNLQSLKVVRPKRAKILIQKVETFVWWGTSSYPSPYKRLYNSATLESSIFVSFQQIAFQIWQLYFPAVLTVFFR